VLEEEQKVKRKEDVSSQEKEDQMRFLFFNINNNLSFWLDFNSVSSSSSCHVHLFMDNDLFHSQLSLRRDNYIPQQTRRELTHSLSLFLFVSCVASSSGVESCDEDEVTCSFLPPFIQETKIEDDDDVFE